MLHNVTNDDEGDDVIYEQPIMIISVSKCYKIQHIESDKVLSLSIYVFQSVSDSLVVYSLYDERPTCSHKTHSTKNKNSLK